MRSVNKKKIPEANMVKKNQTKIKGKEMQTHLLFGVCIVCYVTKIFHMSRVDLFILSTYHTEIKYY